MASGNVFLHMLMRLDIYMVQGGYKTSLRGCSGIKSQPALCLKSFNKVNSWASQLACHTNPLSSRGTNIHIHVCPELGVSMPVRATTECSLSEVAEAPLHRTLAAELQCWADNPFQLQCWVDKPWQHTILILLWSHFPQCWFP